MIQKIIPSPFLSSLTALVSYLDTQDYSWDIVVVNDGSEDNTAELVQNMSQMHNNIKLETIIHAGKGAAIKHGILFCNGKYKFICDADLAMPTNCIQKFVAMMYEGYDIVIGSRQVHGANRYGEPLIRHLMGRIFNFVVQLAVVRSFKDTQCGYKMFKRETADNLFPYQQLNGWGFDVEILFLALKRKYKVLEMPIEWYHREDSKVRIGIDSISMLLDMVVIRWKWISRQYIEKK